MVGLAHFTPIKYTNSNGSFFISQRKSFGHEDMGIFHYHTNYEIYYLLSGERLYFIKDRTYHVKKNDLVFIKPFVLHTVQGVGIPDHDRILIKFNQEFLFDNNAISFEALDLLFNHYCYAKLNSLYINVIENIFETMKQEVCLKSTDFEVNLRALLLQLLVYVARNIDRQEEFPQISPTHARISEIVKYINQNYQDELTLASIAAVFYYNPSYLSRTFKKIIGVGVTDYLNNLRVSQAQKLLKETELNISAIANEVGFKNQSHFGRIFKDIVGISPLQYRKQKDGPLMPTTFRQKR